MAGFERLKKEVIDIGLCVDCGTCVGVCPSKVIEMDYEEEEPRAIAECPPRCMLCYQVCPGQDVPVPDLERMAFGRERTAEEEYTGVVQSFVVANATDPLVRIGGSSGGLVSGLLIYALENDVIDAALVAASSEARPWRVVPKIVTTRKEVMETSQSKLEPVPNNSLIGEALARGYRRLGIVGMPSYVHGIRKMQLLGKPKRAVESIKFVIGLFHGSEHNFRRAEHVIEELGRVPLAEVARIRTRYGAYPGYFTIFTRDGRRVVLPDAGRRAHSFAFRKHRDGMCIDYSSELADISAGDLFDPRMIEGVGGLTLAGIRSDTGKKLMADAEAAGYIHTEPGRKEPFLWGGFETRKHGGLYHMMERKRHGWPVPDYHRPVDYAKPGPRKLGLRTGQMHPHY